MSVWKTSELIGDEDNPEFSAIVSCELEGHPLLANVSTDFEEGNCNKIKVGVFKMSNSVGYVVPLDSGTYNMII